MMICGGKAYIRTTGINYTKNGIAGENERLIIHIKREWVLIIAEWLCHRCRIWAISYNIIPRRCSRKVILYRIKKNINIYIYLSRV